MTNATVDDGRKPKKARVKKKEYYRKHEATRRKKQNCFFEELKNEIPQCCAEAKISKSEIISMATCYIREEKTFKAELLVNHKEQKNEILKLKKEIVCLKQKNSELLQIIQKSVNNSTSPNNKLEKIPELNNSFIEDSSSIEKKDLNKKQSQNLHSIQSITNTSHNSNSFNIDNLSSVSSSASNLKPKCFFPLKNESNVMPQVFVPPTSVQNSSSVMPQVFVPSTSVQVSTVSTDTVILSRDVTHNVITDFGIDHSNPLKGTASNNCQNIQIIQPSEHIIVNDTVKNGSVIVSILPNKEQTNLFNHDKENVDTPLEEGTNNNDLIIQSVQGPFGEQNNALNVNKYCPVMIQIPNVEKNVNNKVIVVQQKKNVQEKPPGNVDMQEKALPIGGVQLLSPLPESSHLTHVTPSLSMAPIMSTGTTQPFIQSGRIIQMNVNPQLLLLPSQSSFVAPAVLPLQPIVPKLRNIAPKPCASECKSMIKCGKHTLICKSQQGCHRHQPIAMKRPISSVLKISPSPKKSMDTTSPSLQPVAKKMKICESSNNNNNATDSLSNAPKVFKTSDVVMKESLDVRLENATDNLTTLKNLEDPNADMINCVGNEQFDNIIEAVMVPVQSPEDRLEEMLRSIDGVDTTNCDFIPPSSPVIAAENLLKVNKSQDTETNLANENISSSTSEPHMLSNKEKFLNITVTTTSTTNSTVSSKALTECSFTNSNYSITALCMSSRPTENLDSSSATNSSSSHLKEKVSSAKPINTSVDTKKMESKINNQSSNQDSSGEGNLKTGLVLTSNEGNSKTGLVLTSNEGNSKTGSVLALLPTQTLFLRAPSTPTAPLPPLPVLATSSMGKLPPKAIQTNIPFNKYNFISSHSAMPTTSEVASNLSQVLTTSSSLPVLSNINNVIMADPTHNIAPPVTLANNPTLNVYSKSSSTHQPFVSISSPTFMSIPKTLSSAPIPSLNNNPITHSMLAAPNACLRVTEISKPSINSSSAFPNSFYHLATTNNFNQPYNYGNVSLTNSTSTAFTFSLSSSTSTITSVPSSEVSKNTSSLTDSCTKTSNSNNNSVITSTKSTSQILNLSNTTSSSIVDTNKVASQLLEAKDIKNTKLEDNSSINAKQNENMIGSSNKKSFSVNNFGSSISNVTSQQKDFDKKKQKENEKIVKATHPTPSIPLLPPATFAETSVKNPPLLNFQTNPQPISSFNNSAGLSYPANTSVPSLLYTHGSSFPSSSMNFDLTCSSLLHNQDFNNTDISYNVNNQNIASNQDLNYMNLSTSSGYFSSLNSDINCFSSLAPHNQNHNYSLTLPESNVHATSQSQNNYQKIESHNLKSFNKSNTTNMDLSTSFNCKVGSQANTSLNNTIFSGNVSNNYTNLNVAYATMPGNISSQNHKASSLSLSTTNVSNTQTHFNSSSKDTHDKILNHDNNLVFTSLNPTSVQNTLATSASFTDSDNSCQSKKTSLHPLFPITTSTSTSFGHQATCNAPTSDFKTSLQNSFVKSSISSQSTPLASTSSSMANVSSNNSDITKSSENKTNKNVIKITEPLPGCSTLSRKTVANVTSSVPKTDDNKSSNDSPTKIDDTKTSKSGDSSLLSSNSKVSSNNDNTLVKKQKVDPTSSSVETCNPKTVGNDDEPSNENTSIVGRHKEMLKFQVKSHRDTHTPQLLKHTNPENSSDTLKAKPLGASTKSEIKTSNAQTSHNSTQVSSPDKRNESNEKDISKHPVQLLTNEKSDLSKSPISFTAKSPKKISGASTEKPFKMDDKSPEKSYKIQQTSPNKNNLKPKATNHSETFQKCELNEKSKHRSNVKSTEDLTNQDQHQNSPKNSLNKSTQDFNTQNQVHHTHHLDFSGQKENLMQQQSTLQQNSCQLSAIQYQHPSSLNQHDVSQHHVHHSQHIGHQHQQQQQQRNQQIPAAVNNQQLIHGMKPGQNPHANNIQHQQQNLNQHSQLISNQVTGDSSNVRHNTGKNQLLSNVHQGSYQHQIPVVTTASYVQPSFDYTNYYRKPPHSPRADNRHHCYGYKQQGQYQGTGDVIADTSMIHADSRPTMGSSFLDPTEDLSSGRPAIENTSSDHVQSFSVSQLVNHSSETRKSSLPNQKETNAEDKSKDTSKTKSGTRKSENKSRSSNNTTSSSSKNNSNQTVVDNNSRRRSPARASNNQQTAGTSGMWGNKTSPGHKQNHNYSTEALLSSQNYARPTHRPSNQNYLMAPNQMYQSSYSTQQMKNLTQDASFGYGTHDRSGQSNCNPNYNFQFHPQPTGTFTYGSNMAYMTPPGYPYQNLPPSSTGMLSGDIMTPHPSTAYHRLHEYHTDQTNFPPNPTFPLPLDPQEMCAGPPLMPHPPPPPTASASMAMSVRASQGETNLSVTTTMANSRGNANRNNSMPNSNVSSNNVPNINNKRVRYGEANMMAGATAGSHNILEAPTLPHITLSSFTPPCDDPTLMHSNFFSGPSRHQSNFLLGSENLISLNNSQYPNGSNISSGTVPTSGSGQLGMLGPRGCPPPLPPPVLPHTPSGHMMYDPLRMKDRQQMNVVFPTAPHLSSSLSNFNLTSIIPEIDAKNVENSSSNMATGVPRSMSGNENNANNMGSSLLPPAEMVKPFTHDGNHRIPPPVLNNSMNNIFPPSHQMSLSLNSSLTLPSTSFSTINFSGSNH